MAGTCREAGGNMDESTLGCTGGTGMRMGKGCTQMPARSAAATAEVRLGVGWVRQAGAHSPVGLALLVEGM